MKCKGPRTFPANRLEKNPSIHIHLSTLTVCPPSRLLLSKRSLPLHNIPREKIPPPHPSIQCCPLPLPIVTPVLPQPPPPSARTRPPTSPPERDPPHFPPFPFLFQNSTTRIPTQNASPSSHPETSITRKNPVIEFVKYIYPGPDVFPFLRIEFRMGWLVCFRVLCTEGFGR